MLLNIFYQLSKQLHTVPRPYEAVQNAIKTHVFVLWMSISTYVLEHKNILGRESAILQTCYSSKLREQ